MKCSVIHNKNGIVPIILYPVNVFIVFRQDKETENSNGVIMYI